MYILKRICCAGPSGNSTRFRMSKSVSHSIFFVWNIQTSKQCSCSWNCHKGESLSVHIWCSKRKKNRCVAFYDYLSIVWHLTCSRDLLLRISVVCMFNLSGTIRTYRSQKAFLLSLTMFFLYSCSIRFFFVFIQLVLISLRALQSCWNIQSIELCSHFKYYE